MKKIFAALCATAAFPICAMAGNSQGPVTEYIVNTQGKLFFVAGTQNSKPSCSTGAWAVDLTGPNSTGGKAILAAIIAARASGRTVVVVGTGACDVWPDRETVSYVGVY